MTLAEPFSDDPQWIAHRLDRAADMVQLRHVPRALHGGFPFLTEEYVGDQPMRSTPRADAVARARARQAPLRLIFHSAFCASTLLCRAFDRPGVAMGLSEPPILNDIVGMRRRREIDQRQTAQALDEAMALLARPWQAGEAVVVKPSNILNPLAAGMLLLRPEAKAVLLHAPLPVFLASVARKGMWCRLWVRELLEGMLTDGAVDLGFAPEDYFRHTDLQCAAVGWLAQHRLFAAMVDRFGPDRVVTLDSETLLTDPAACLRALAQHFDLPVDAALAAELASGPAFRRHSKFGGQFDAADRAAERDAALAVHGDEIDKVTIWAEAVAAAQSLPMQLPGRLL